MWVHLAKLLLPVRVADILSKEYTGAYRGTRVRDGHGSLQLMQNVTTGSLILVM
jgi:hypothetical protein